MKAFAAILVFSVVAINALAAPIHDSSGKGDLAKVKTLIAKDPKLVNAKDGNGATPLHFAVAGGHKAVAEFLLSKKADVNAKKKDGVTPLHVAAAMGRTEIAKLLLAKGANKNVSDSKGRTPLTLAGEKGNAEMIDLLSGKAATPKPGVKVVSIPKDAVVLRGGKKVAGIAKGTELKLGDVLENGKAGDFVIHVGDTAAIRLKPGAKLKLTKLTLTGDLDIRTDLQGGDALARVRALTGQSRFQMASPGAVVAVKGTAFALKVNGEESTVIVGEGKVGVALPSEPGKEVDVLDGEMVTAGKGALPQSEPVGAAESEIIQQMLEEALPSVELDDSSGAPQPGSAAINPKDGAEMVWVSAGEFTMGSTAEQIVEARSGGSTKAEWFEGEQPQRKVYLDGYWIYRNEVTVAQYQKFCLETGRKMPTAPSWGWNSNYPIENVDWQDAGDYAKWAGGKLPTEAQWEKAARGTDGRIFPWGNEFDAWGCNNGYTDPKATPGQDRTEPVGSYPADASPYGCMDMAGNVCEWCADWYAGDYYKSAPTRNPTGPSDGERRVVRGGSWGVHAIAYFRCAKRFGIGPTDPCGGFRCVRTP